MLSRTKYMRISWHEFSRACDVVDLDGVACEEEYSSGRYIYFNIDGSYVADSDEQLGRKIGTIYKLKKEWKIAPWYATVEQDGGIYG